MKFSLRKSLLPLLMCGGLVLAFGCTQHDDVVQPLTSSTITLEPDYLPELDDIYYYELWMVKVANDGDDFTADNAVDTSVLKFLWDNAVYRFRDLNGNAISNKVELPESWFAYDYIVVTVENIGDTDPEPSGVYILAAEIVNQKIPQPIVMKFPGFAFLATGFYFVGTPTNDTTYYDLDPEVDSLVRVSEEEEKGLWICSRFLTERNLHDTLSVISLDTAMVVDTFDTVGKWDPDTIGIEWPPNNEFEVIFDTVVFGYDTFQHRRIDIVWKDTVDTFYDYIRYPEFLIDSQTTVEYDYPLGRIPYYEYSGPLDALPDISPYGWRYNAWIILEQPDPGETIDNTGLDLSAVIPFGDGEQEMFTGENTWGVLPLGAFNVNEDGIADAPDLSNPYIWNREVPQFPGEDFIINAAPRFNNLNLRRIADHSWGFIVIGMEPDPEHVSIAEDTNFPLFVLSSELAQGNTFGAYSVQVFHNYSQFLPEINIDVEMHD